MLIKLLCIPMLLLVDGQRSCSLLGMDEIEFTIARLDAVAYMLPFALCSR